MIEIKNLTFSYQKNKALFDNLSLACEQGSIVGLLGKNGAGKSTLLNLINGFIAPKAGEISVNGFTPMDRKPDYLADAYMVPEEFSFPNVSIEVYAKAYIPLFPRFDREKLDNILQEFDLQPKNQLNKLSHGQRKKFLIAFALASNSRLLLLDEPTNGLDIPSKSQFRKILVSSITDDQLVIISTHQVKDIDSVIDKVVVMDNGKIAYDKSVNEITETMSFETVPSLEGENNILYSEPIPMGYRVIRQTDSFTDTPLDLELLFNYITNQ